METGGEFDTLSSMTGARNSKAHIIIAEDETGLRNSIVEALDREGFLVSACADGIEALEAYRSTIADLMVLDINMPRMDGLELLREIRKQDDELAVIFLSSRDEEIDRVLGLELGADDYLGKPFSLRELIARIRVLLRRLERSRHDGEEERSRWGILELDHRQYKAYILGRNIGVTITEFRILESLFRVPGQVKTREILMSEAYPDDVYVADRSIDGHIKRLRRKIQHNAPDFDPIETVYGLGYSLSLEVQQGGDRQA